MNISRIITVRAPVNIAVIKYWGKRDEELILPLNDSVSATLDTGVMCAKTSICASPDFEEDEIWLNCRKELFSKRMQNCLIAVKHRAAQEQTVDKDFISWKIHVCSENNFPTAAGLASSAAGYACLVTAFAKLYKIKSDISSIARLGSGSACRSVYGGFVRWRAGLLPCGSDSFATQVAEKAHWPEMSAIILVVGETRKKISSTRGMKISSDTSELLQYRINKCVPERTEEICQAIIEKNFTKFAEITMKESNQFHAICLDSYPPITYMTETSHKIVEIVHKYNNFYGENKVAYTFDAGPNACLYLLESEVPMVFTLIKHIFPSSSPESFLTGLPIKYHPLTDDLIKAICIESDPIDSIKYAIHTKVGDGPVEDTIDHLLDEFGKPITSIVTG